MSDVTFVEATSYTSTYSSDASIDYVSSETMTGIVEANAEEES